MTKEEMKIELDKLIDIRKDFYEFLDTNIPKDEKGMYDFENSTLSSEEVYKRFFKLDYQSRKLRGFLVKAYDLKAE